LGVRLEIIEDQFSKYATNQNELSILIGVDSLSYIVTNTNRDVLLLRECALAGTALGDFFLGDEYLRLSYRTIKAAIFSPIFTFVPSRLYNIAERQTFLQQIVTFDTRMDTRADDLPAIGANNVYALEPDRLDTVRKYTGSGKIFHTTSALLHSLLAFNEKRNRSVFLHVTDGKLILILLEGTNLLFANVFSYQSAKDFLYYVMLVFEQFKLAPEEVPAYASGQLLEDSEVFQTVQNYLNKLTFLPPPKFLNFSQKWQQHQPHFFADLFGLTQCK